MRDQEQYVIDYMNMREKINERLEVLRKSVESMSELYKLQLTQIEYDLDALSYSDGYYEELKIKQKEEKRTKSK